MGTGYAGPGWVWLIKPLTAILPASCCRNFARKGERIEQPISEVITFNLALSVPYSLGSEVSLSDPARADKRNGGEIDPGHL